MSNNDFRSLVLRGSSASVQDLAPYRDGSRFTIKQLVDEVTQKVINNNTNNNNNEYETGCALRFISRCMVASDDATGRDQDAIVPRSDLMLASPSSSSSTSALSVESFTALADLFCSHVSQNATGLIAIDGIQRLIYSTFTINNNNNNNNNVSTDTKSTKIDCDEEKVQEEYASTSSSSLDEQHFVDRKYSLIKIVDVMFIELNVQELPTMSRRNAIKILQWFTATATKTCWKIALECCLLRLTEQENKKTNNTTLIKMSSLERLQVTSQWLELITRSLTEERDPVNVLSLFYVCLGVHSHLEQDALFVKKIAPKLIFSEAEYQQYKNQQTTENKNNNDDADDSEEIEDDLVDELAQETENLFQTAVSYFPLQFAPAPGSSIKKETLIDRLHSVLASKLYFSFAIPQVLHKLKSATSTITASQCLDVLERGINEWKEFLSNNHNNKTNTFFTTAFAQLVCRRFLRELFPFFRAYIQSNAAGESESIAARVVATLAAAASAYDISYSSSSSSSSTTTETRTSFTSILRECNTLKKITSVLPNTNADSEDAVYLDASLVHALGKHSPILSVIFASTVLPLVADDNKKIAICASVFAVLEMNSAPIINNNSNESTKTLGDSTSDNATKLSSLINSTLFLDEKSKSNIQNFFLVALKSACEIVGSFPSSSSSSSTFSKQQIRAASDIIASSSCLLARKIIQFQDNEQHQTTQDDATAVSPLSTSSIESLIVECISTLVSRWRYETITRTSSSQQQQQQDSDFTRALSSAVSVCLAVKPELFNSGQGAEKIALVVSSGNEEQQQKETEGSGFNIIRATASSMNAILDGAVSKYPSEIVTRVLINEILQLRTLAVAGKNKNIISESQESNQQQLLSANAVTLVDRFCVAPLISIILSLPSATSSISLKYFFTTLIQHHLMFNAGEATPRSKSQEIQSFSLPSLIELVVETLFCLTAASSSTSNAELITPIDKTENNIVSTSFSAQILTSLLSNSSQQNESTDFITSTLLPQLLPSSPTDDESENNKLLLQVSRLTSCFIVVKFPNVEDQKAELKKISDSLLLTKQNNVFFFKSVLIANVLRLNAIKNQSENAETFLTSFISDLFLPSLDNEQQNKNDNNYSTSETLAICELLRPTCLKIVESSSSSSSSSCCRGKVSNNNNNNNNNCCGASSSSSSCSSSSSWQLQIAHVFLKCVMSSKSDANKALQLRRSTALIEAANSYYFTNHHQSNDDEGDEEGQTSNIFKQILVSNHKDILTLVDFSSTSITQSSQQYQQDCLTLLEWLLLAKNATTKEAALEYLIFDNKNKNSRRNEDAATTASKQDASLLQSLADMVVVASSPSTSSVSLTLSEKLRPLKILTEVGRTVLDMCLEKKNGGQQAKMFEAAVRPLISVIVKKVQSALNDKKRIIRSEAAECKHLWLLIPKQD